jgi:hypothetical protein
VLLLLLTMTTFHSSMVHEHLQMLAEQPKRLEGTGLLTGLHICSKPINQNREAFCVGALVT